MLSDFDVYNSDNNTVLTFNYTLAFMIYLPGNNNKVVPCVPCG